VLIGNDEADCLRDVLVEHGSVWGAGNCRICGVARCPTWLDATTGWRPLARRWLSRSNRNPNGGVPGDVAQDRNPGPPRLV
jgi:hypothetical protein